MNQDQLLKQLHAHRPFDATEAAHQQALVAFVAATPHFALRSHTEVGHVTGSAWIVNFQRSHVLLTHHRKLDRWLQLGGHIENDDDILSAALREAYEESGLDEVQAVQATPFDLDVHRIPANAKEASHLHFDIRFLLEADHRAPLKLSNESKALRWFSLAEAYALGEDPSILRMLDKTKSLVTDRK